MRMLRDDLSEWALHFIHDYNERNEPEYGDINFNHYRAFPYHEDKELNDRFDLWEISDEEYPIDPGPDALHVLLKIITDGHIRATWAFRNRRPTIYGPRAAVCFTEMPLYALLDYAKQRRDDSVKNYAIGVLKNELFSTGGRPVIYGLSGRHAELLPDSSSGRRWPRKLAPSCGLSENEQYRYVAMSSDSNRPIDWSHEREWRWVDLQDRCSCPGIPIWLSEEPVSFSRVFIVVPSEEESERILDRLKELHDAGANDYDQLFSKTTLENTFVISLDNLESGLTEAQMMHLRLEDIPSSRISIIRRPEASRDLVAKVRFALAEAKKAADKAAEEHSKTAPRTPDGRHVADVAGWAHLIVYDSQTSLVSALLELDEAYSVPGSGYVINGIGGLGWGNEQALSLAETHVRAAKTVFENYFPDISFGVRTRWD